MDLVVDRCAGRECNYNGVTVSYGIRVSPAERTDTSDATNSSANSTTSATESPSPEWRDGSRGSLTDSDLELMAGMHRANGRECRVEAGRGEASTGLVT
jgi:hypothetical protein